MENLTEKPEVKILLNKMDSLIDYRSKLLAQFVYEKNYEMVNKYVSLNARADNTLKIEFNKRLSETDLKELQIRLSDYNLKVRKYNENIRALNEDISEVKDSNVLSFINNHMAEYTQKSFNAFFYSNNSNGAFNTLIKRGVLSEDIQVYVTEENKVAGKINVKNTELGEYCLNKIKEKNDSYLNSVLLLEHFANKARLNCIDNNEQIFN